MEPIFNSQLDVDFYKFPMAQMVFHKYPDVPVRYALTNRTSGVNLADHIRQGDVRYELDHVRTLRFGNSDLHYLRGTNEHGMRMFAEDYLDFLRTLQLPPYDLFVSAGQLKLEFSGRWCEAIYWETIALSIINELYNRSQLNRLSKFAQDLVYAEGKQRLGKKIIQLRHEAFPVMFSDFGTRRRFSREWQDYVIGVLVEELPKNFIGTSNVAFAQKYNIVPMGTSAHELYMAMGAIMEARGRSVKEAQQQVMQDWWDEFGWGLSIALTDTWGTDFFFEQMTHEQARDWKGLRQDSGDPFAFGEKALRFYKFHNVDSQGKMIIFSDGLDVATMIELNKRFRDYIRVSFGWGTNLTNDLGIPALSLVVKLIEAMGRGTVKLSDNLAKAVGRAEDIERYKRELGYTNTFFQNCKY